VSPIVAQTKPELPQMSSFTQRESLIPIDANVNQGFQSPSNTLRTDNTAFVTPVKPLNFGQNFTQNFTQHFTQNFAQNFTQNFTQTPSHVSTQFNETFNTSVSHQQMVQKVDFNSKDHSFDGNTRFGHQEVFTPSLTQPISETLSQPIAQPLAKPLISTQVFSSKGKPITQEVEQMPLKSHSVKFNTY